MKKGLLISHSLEDEHTAVRVIDAEASDAEVDAVIFSELSNWPFPPKFFNLVHDNDMIQIVYDDDTIDPVIFRTSEVDVDF